MKNDYNHSKVEKKWQTIWAKKKVYKAEDKSKGKKQKKKFYSLIEFPYPSGDGLHVGHIRSNTAMDIISRKRRAEGYNVLYPIGWDAFGLPTENYAIKTGIPPAVVTKKNTDTFRRQLKSLGFSFDWDREVNTTDPKYYKWTQWIFLQMLKHDLAYKAKMAINWCPKDKIGLANEEVIDGCCERCGTVVEKREKEQWMLRITKYADRLDKDLDTVDYLEKIKIQQRNWIGKSEGAEINFQISIKNKKPRFVLLHGFEGSSSRNFFPWLKKSLEDSGYEVMAPELPNTMHPSEEKQVNFVLENCTFDENTVILGHSLGAIVAMKVLVKLNKPISGFTLVAPAVDPKFHKDSHRFKKDFNWDFDYALLKKLTNGRMAILADTREKFRMPYLEHLSKELGARLVQVKSEKQHFCDYIEPEILKAVTPFIKVFTTRPDTIFGATYVVLSPEHAWVSELLPKLENRKEVEEYIAESKNKTELERTDEGKSKTGVELKGLKAVNPANGEELPIWIADYVLASYGTGAIMAVPAHDKRDFEFAKKYKLEIKEVIEAETGPVLPNEQLRKSIAAIVEDPKTKKFLTLNWGPKLGGTLFIGGGREENEDIVQTALREIREETGYTNLTFLNQTGIMHHHYFAFSKNVARNIEVIGLHFRLNSQEQVDTALEENEKFKIEWLSKEEILKKMEDEQHLLSFHKLILGEIYSGKGILANSGKFNGMESEKAKKEIVKFVGGKIVTKYKLRDWVFSRQRYWGEPIPVVHCDTCGIVPLREKDLPLVLPKVAVYQPTDTGESPLASITKWVNTTCPECKGKARRETDTMPNWAGSSWYFLRYIDPKNSKQLADPKKLKYMMPVDWYNGGMEHTTLHLLYSRFWNKFLYDIGVVPFSEPYKKRTSHGLILQKGGEKMSKSKGNVVNPDDIVKTFGADTLRMYEMFMGPFDQAISWGEENILGVRRFLERVWRLQSKVTNKKVITEEKLQSLLHKTVKKVGDDIETMAFNTAVSSMMILLNEMERQDEIAKKDFEMFLKVLSPFAPHITEEIWHNIGNKTLLVAEAWPKADPRKMKESEVNIAVQINNKVRAVCKIDAGSGEMEVLKIAKGLVDVDKWLIGKRIEKVVFVKDKLINIIAV